MNTGRNPWDDDYRRRGRLWGGSAGNFPGLGRRSRVLELGCGNGKTVSSLVQGGCCVTAVDFSQVAASLCRNSCTEPDRLQVLIADIRQTPFCNACFDGIVASHITGHLLRKGRGCLAGEVLRLLDTGGTLYFSDFSTGDFRNGQGEETEQGTFLRKNGIATHYFTADEVISLFSGLAVQSLVEHRWEMPVRGRVLPRAEIVAEFKKTD